MAESALIHTTVSQISFAKAFNFTVLWLAVRKHSLRGKETICTVQAEFSSPQVVGVKRAQLSLAMYHSAEKKPQAADVTLDVNS